MISGLSLGKSLTLLTIPHRFLDGESTVHARRAETGFERDRGRLGVNEEPHTIQECNTDKTRSVSRASKSAHRVHNAPRHRLAATPAVDTEQFDLELESGIGWNDRWESTSAVRLFKENTDQPPCSVAQGRTPNSHSRGWQST